MENIDIISEMNRPLLLSVVIPMKNEETNIVSLFQRLFPVLHGLDLPFEVICIDDGSTDKTLNTLLT